MQARTKIKIHAIISNSYRDSQEAADAMTSDPFPPSQRHDDIIQKQATNYEAMRVGDPPRSSSRNLSVHVKTHTFSWTTRPETQSDSVCCYCCRLFGDFLPSAILLRSSFAEDYLWEFSVQNKHRFALFLPITLSVIRPKLLFS